MRVDKAERSAFKEEGHTHRTLVAERVGQPGRHMRLLNVTDLVHVDGSHEHDKAHLPLAADCDNFVLVVTAKVLLQVRNPLLLVAQALLRTDDNNVVENVRVRHRIAAQPCREIFGGTSVAWWVVEGSKLRGVKLSE